MLHILGRNAASHCDCHTRRHFLKIGGLALGGLSLPQILQAEQSSPATRGRSLGSIVLAKARTGCR